VRVRATTSAARDAGADTVAIGVFEGKDVSHDVDGVLQALLDSGEAKRGFKKLAVTHAAGLRWIVVGLGKRDEFDAERARVAAAVALERAREIGASVFCWELPHRLTEDEAVGFVEGTLLAAYRFDAYKSARDEAGAGPQELVISDHEDRSELVERVSVTTQAANAARDLQNTPSNDKTPTRIAERARALAAELGLQCEVLGREQIRAAGMGAFSAVAQGSDEEPALITLRYEGPGAHGPVLGFVGKGVTFDSGGISIKPGAGMADMKFDMSGAAAVLHATEAIARLKLPVRLVTVIGATENMPSGKAYRPGDIVRSKSGTTIEVINTDAEGRLVLADCLTHARDCGAERLVDLATLTGAMKIALGDIYAGLFGTDDEWCDAVLAAAETTGEIAWRLPLHPEYADRIKGTYGDIVNAKEDRKAGAIGAAEFLHRFAGDVPWVHLDIAGVADNNGRAYTRKGGSGWGVRLLVELARRTVA
jgi:leucyl aminopeptidase